jgi:hypothetical protein
LALKHVTQSNNNERAHTLNLTQKRSAEISEDKIVEAVEYAVSNDFNLDHLSRLLVVEGGVDLDTLARIIRENRVFRTDANHPPIQPQTLHIGPTDAVSGHTTSTLKRVA